MAKAKAKAAGAKCACACSRARTAAQARHRLSVQALGLRKFNDVRELTGFAVRCAV